MSHIRTSCNLNRRLTSIFYLVCDPLGYTELLCWCIYYRIFSAFWCYGRYSGGMRVVCNKDITCNHNLIQPYPMFCLTSNFLLKPKAWTKREMCGKTMQNIIPNTYHEPCLQREIYFQIMQMRNMSKTRSSYLVCIIMIILILFKEPISNNLEFNTHRWIFR